jgi:hypothetical protein
MEETMSIQQVAVGKDLYVFTSKVNPGPVNNAWGANPNCIIDSHGYRPLLKPNFTVKDGMTIFFYVNRHAFLKVSEKTWGVGDRAFRYASSIEAIAKNQVQAVETIGEGVKCPDYELSKQVASHDGKAKNRYDYIDYDALTKFLERHPDIANAYDLVSIRNRQGRNVMLSSALDSLLQNGYAYANIHCSFCRGGIIDGIKDLFGKGLNEKVGGIRV